MEEVASSFASPLAEGGGVREVGWRAGFGKTYVRVSEGEREGERVRMTV